MVYACKKDEPATPDTGLHTTPYARPVVNGLGQLPDNAANPLTVEGVELGRLLFYDSILSIDSTISCASCHKQELAFTDGRGISTGVHGRQGNRSSMPLFNLGYQKGPFFWDGRALTLEEQVVQPVFNPAEMDLSWDEAVIRLRNREEYRQKFEKAFGPDKIDKDHAALALAQFLRTIVSGDTRFDRYVRTFAGFTELEKKGYNLFKNDPMISPVDRSRKVDDPQSGVDCGHCHSSPLFVPEVNFGPMRNNGTLVDGAIRNVKVPSLRNLAFTGPYMHAGQIPDLDSVINFYDHGFAKKRPRELDEKMYINLYTNGDPLTMEMTASEKQALKAFLLTLTDSGLIKNPAYGNPFHKK